MIYLIEIFNGGILNFNKIEIERWKFLMLKIEINSLILMYLKIKKVILSKRIQSYKEELSLLSFKISNFY